jgi:hypothetical protein
MPKKWDCQRGIDEHVMEPVYNPENGGLCLTGQGLWYVRNAISQPFSAPATSLRVVAP